MKFVRRFHYDVFQKAHIGIIGEMPKPDGIGKIVIVPGEQVIYP